MVGHSRSGVVMGATTQIPVGVGEGAEGTTTTAITTVEAGAAIRMDTGTTIDKISIKILPEEGLPKMILMI